MEPITDVEQILDQAEEALDQGYHQQAADLCNQVLALLPGHVGALFLLAEIHRDIRDLPGAESGFRKVLAVMPEHSATWSALAAVYFDMLRHDEAQTCVTRAIRENPANPEAYYVRALLRERRGDMHGADRDYLRAARLSPDAYPSPTRLDDATVESVVEQALRDLHPSIRSYLEQVAILLEEVPDLELCAQYHPPAAPAELLGFYSGVPLSERSTENPWSNLPSAIVLFRRNLERLAWDEQQLIDELRITVFHEVGHFLGLDEDDLAERGLD